VSPLEATMFALTNARESDKTLRRRVTEDEDEVILPRVEHVGPCFAWLRHALLVGGCPCLWGPHGAVYDEGDVAE